MKIECRSIPDLSKEQIQKFFNLVNKENSCWLWTGRTDSGGHGLFTYKYNNKWTQVRSHRLSFKIHNGYIDSDKFCLHICNKTFCVNPDHLYLGSLEQNALDRSNDYWKNKV